MNNRTTFVNPQTAVYRDRSESYAARDPIAPTARSTPAAISADSCLRHCRVSNAQAGKLLIRP